MHYRTTHGAAAALAIAAVLNGCSAGPPLPIHAPPPGASTSSSATPAPVERSVTLDLDKVVAGGGFYVELPSTKNGSAVTLSVSFGKYKGTTMRVRYGPLRPKGVGAIPGSRKVLLWVTITVDKTAVANGEWNVVLKDGACLPKRTGGAYYPARGAWSTTLQVACRDFVILPQWTVLVPGTQYVSAMYVP